MSEDTVVTTGEEFNKDAKAALMRTLGTWFDEATFTAASLTPKADRTPAQTAIVDRMLDFNRILRALDPIMTAEVDAARKARAA